MKGINKCCGENSELLNKPISVLGTRSNHGYFKCLINLGMLPLFQVYLIKSMERDIF